MLQACLHTSAWSRQTTTFNTWSARPTLLCTILPRSTPRSCGHGCSVLSLPNVFLRLERIPAAVSGADLGTFTPAVTAMPSPPWTLSSAWRSTSKTRTTPSATSPLYLGSKRALRHHTVLLQANDVCLDWTLSDVFMVLAGWPQTWKTWKTWNTLGFFWTWKTQGILGILCNLRETVTNKVFLVRHSNIWVKQLLTG